MELTLYLSVKLVGYNFGFIFVLFTFVDGI